VIGPPVDLSVLLHVPEDNCVPLIGFDANLVTGLAGLDARSGWADAECVSFSGLDANLGRRGKILQNSCDFGKQAYYKTLVILESKTVDSLCTASAMILL
jgi:hypothetical protein